MARAFPTAVIENLRPLINGGRYPIKRIAGDDLAVEADVFKDGHDVVAAALKWRLVGERSEAVLDRRYAKRRDLRSLNVSQLEKDRRKPVRSHLTNAAGRRRRKRNTSFFEVLKF